MQNFKNTILSLVKLNVFNNLQNSLESERLVTFAKKKMELPKFLLGDNTDCPDDIFIIHTEFPRFVINLVSDEVEWFDDLEGDESDLANEMTVLIEEAGAFYDREMERYVE